MGKGAKKGAVLLLAALMAFEAVPMTVNAAEESAVAAYAEAAAREAARASNKKEAYISIEELKSTLTVDSVTADIGTDKGNGSVEIPDVVTADSVTTGTAGPNNGINWSYDSETMTLTISGTETDFKGGYPSEDADYPISPLSLISPDAVKIIVENCTLSGEMQYLFANLPMLEEIEFHNFNTSQVTDMHGLFHNSYALLSLDLSSFNTANVWDMGEMFAECMYLESIDLSSFNTANVTNMKAMFDFCSDLVSLDLSNFNTAKVTDMSFMFEGCETLTSLDLSNFNTEKLTSMTFMFSWCDALESLDVSSFNTAQVWEMAYAFANCPGLKELDLSHFNTSNVEIFNGMFDDCTGLTDLDISSFDTTSAYSISKMFTNCAALEILDLSSFDLTDTPGGAEEALDGCDSLNVLYTPKAMAADITITLPAAFHVDAETTISEVTNAHSNMMLLRNLPTEARDIILSAPKDVNEITIGNSLQLSLIVDGEALPVERNKDYIWTVDNPEVITVSDTGLVTGVGMGIGVVTCTYKFNPQETLGYQFVIEVPFTDVKATDWQYPYVVYAYENNLMSGKGEGKFDMNGKLTRSEFVTVLYSYTGKPDTTYEQQFSDVKSNAWYALAVTWAKKQGITAGNADGTFGVNSNIQRQQLVLMLYNYAKNNGVATGTVTVDLSTYADESKVSTWAKEALTWAVQNGVITGKTRDGVTYLDPTGSTTRGECATMMMRYVELAK